MSTDKRVRRTEKLLFSALVKLLGSKPINKITVKELCEEADINRGTFYAHYVDQYALMDKLIDSVSQGIEVFFTYSEKAKDLSEIHMLLLRVFDYVRQNSELCRVLLSNNIRFDMNYLIIEFMSEKYIFNTSELKIENEKAKKYICSFILTGALGIFRDWLDGGMVEDNESMTSLLLNLVKTGTSTYK